MELNMIHQMGKIAKNPIEVDRNNIARILGGRTLIKKTRIQRLKYWGHISRRPPNHVLRTALTYVIPGKKKIGRPCFTWNESLQ